MSTCTLQEMAFFPSNFILQSHDEDDHNQPPTSITPILSSQDFHGVGSFLGKRSMSFTGGGNNIQHHEFYQEEANGNGNGDEMSDDEDGSSQGVGGEKKRRLNMEQVKTLEKNFELGNKLEPERKLQLARALGLQPRQIAIWFQNRRARWKTKQLEKDYELLKRQFDAVKAENDSLKSHNQKLHAEIMALKNREPTTELINLNKETEGSCSNRSTENSSDINLDISRGTPPAIDSNPNTTNSNRPPPPNCTTLFPSNNNNNNNSTTIRQQQQHHHQPPPPPHQLFHNNSSTARPDHLQSQKFDHHHHHHQQTVKEESFSNMFCGIDDQTAFWPWLEQQQFS